MTKVLSANNCNEFLGFPAIRVCKKTTRRSGYFLTGSKLLRGMMLVLFVMATLSVSAQHVREGIAVEKETANGAVSTLKESEDFISFLIGLSAKTDLEFRTCSLTAGLTSADDQIVSLSVHCHTMENIKNFFSALNQNLSVNIQKISAKPFFSSDPASAAMEFKMELALSTDRNKTIGSGFEEIVKPFENLSFFINPQEIKPGINLLGFSFTPVEKVSFQIASKDFKKLVEFSSKSPVSLNSSTISKSNFSGIELFNLNLSQSSNLIPAREMIEFFESLSMNADVREISLQKAPDGNNLFRINIFANTDKLPLISNEFMNKKTLALGKCETFLEPPSDVTGMSGDKWNFTLFLIPSVKPNFPGDDLAEILKAPWPSNLKSGLRISWTPAACSISFRVTSDAEAESLKPTAQNLKFTYQGLKKEISVQENKLVVGFYRESANGQPAGTMLLNPPLGDFFGFGEVLETTPVNAGKRIAVRFPFPDFPKLLSALSSQQGKSILEFSLTVKHPQKAEAVFVITEGVAKNSDTILSLAKIILEARLPWNLPDEALDQGLIVQGLAIHANLDVFVYGITLKNKYIFSNLFPMLNSIKGINAPFFREGKYSDHPKGRLMAFEVSVKWQDQ